MRLLVLYDISNDELRRDVARACETHGLVRVQLSAYAGDVSAVQAGRLEFHLRLYGESEASCPRRSIQIVRLCGACAGAVRYIGTPTIAPLDGRRAGLRFM